MTFLGVWFALNLVFGLTGGAGLASGAVAWDAHLGGFLAGLLLFRFSIRCRAPQPDPVFCDAACQAAGLVASCGQGRGD